MRFDNDYRSNVYSDSIYFFTGLRFDKHPYVDRLDDNKKHVEKHIFEQLTVKVSSCIKYYSMNWISQISFFHRYFNNRVIYVTGSTGVGKSTQVPKLLLYALKAFDYKNQGKIACTQPRINPTENNPKRIAHELGLPITKHVRATE